MPRRNINTLILVFCLLSLAAGRLQSPKDDRPRKILLPQIRVPARAAPRVVVPPNSVMLRWNQSPSTNVTGDNVYYGVASRTYTNKVNVGLVTNAIISQLYGLTNSAVTYYFTVTAYDNNALESDYSNEVWVKKLDTIVTVSTGTNRLVLTNSAATSQFWRLRGLSWTNSELLATPGVLSNWQRVAIWSYPSNSVPKLSITVTHQ